MKFEIIAREDKEVPWALSLWLLWFVHYISGLTIITIIGDWKMYWIYLTISAVTYLLVFLLTLFKFRRIK